MMRVNILREQATKIRVIADTVGSPTLRADLLVLAKRSEELADEIAREVTERASQPIDRAS
jgi:hypothetical protein